MPPTQADQARFLVTSVFCFPAGGSISNMYAMNVARYHRFPDCKRRGLWALPRLAVFTSKEVQLGGVLGCWISAPWERAAVMGGCGSMLGIARCCCNNGDGLGTQQSLGQPASLSHGSEGV